MSLPENFQVYEKTLLLSNPPDLWPEALQAMWLDAKGNWEKSHDIALERNFTTANWLHVYLLRKEGDNWNARYWYHRANRVFPSFNLKEERQEIVVYLLANQGFK